MHCSKMEKNSSRMLSAQCTFDSHTNGKYFLQMYVHSTHAPIHICADFSCYIPTSMIHFISNGKKYTNTHHILYSNFFCLFFLAILFQAIYFYLKTSITNRVISAKVFHNIFTLFASHHSNELFPCIMYMFIYRWRLVC